MSDTDPYDIDRLVSDLRQRDPRQTPCIDHRRLCLIIAHSCAIEGSTITVEEAKRLLGEGVNPAMRTHHEQMMVLDLKSAYEVVTDIARSHAPITPALLKGLAALVMRNTGALHLAPNGTYDEARGEFRLQNVRAGRAGRSHVACQKVVPRMDELCTWLNRQLAGIDGLRPKDVYQLSFEAHLRLVTIHPWADGNGRVSRLLMNLVQLKGGMLPSYVRSDAKDNYIAALNAARDATSSEAFCDFMTRETARDLTLELARC